jgi:hypothetical protein
MVGGKILLLSIEDEFHERNEVVFICLIDFYEIRSHYVALDGLKISVFLLQPSEYWNYRCTSPQLAFEMIFDEKDV